MKRETIKIEHNTKKRLKKLGIKGSTYDFIINELIDHAQSCDQYWVDK